MSVLEALACGIPIILSSRCSISDYFKNKVGLVVKPSPASLARAILQLLNNPELTNFFKKNCRDVVKYFDINRVVRKLEEIYNEIKGVNKFFH